MLAKYRLESCARTSADQACRVKGATLPPTAPPSARFSPPRSALTPQLYRSTIVARFRARPSPPSKLFGGTCASMQPETPPHPSAHGDGEGGPDGDGGAAAAAMWAAEVAGALETVQLGLAEMADALRRLAGEAGGPGRREGGGGGRARRKCEAEGGKHVGGNVGER
ncbi:unnamed protein product [Closterium sp. NIES-65]|nr:unnamed protein product [Closterium sp. NIES-65]